MTKQGTGHYLRLGFYGGLQRATVIVFGMVSTILLTHFAIEPEEMGVWSLYLVLTAFIEMLRHGLVKNSFIKYAASSGPEDQASVFTGALVLNILITFILAVVLMVSEPLIVAYTKAPDLGSMLYWNLLAMLFLIPFSQLEWLMLSRLNFKDLFWTYVSRHVVTLSLLAVFLLSGIKVTLDLLVLFYSLGILAGALTGFALNRKEVGLSMTHMGKLIKKLFHFGRSSFGTGLSTLVFRSTDTFMVSNLLASTAIVAQQGIALRILNLADIPSQMIGDIVFQKSAGISSTDKQTIRSYYERSVGTTLGIILPAILVVMLIPDLLIMFVAGSEYLAAVPYLRALMFVSIFLCYPKQFGTIIDSTEKPGLNFRFTTCLAVVNIASCYFFIREYGLMGAAYALLCTHTLFFIISQYILYRLYRIRFWYSFLYAFRLYPEMGRFFHKKISPQ